MKILTTKNKKKVQFSNNIIIYEISNSEEDRLATNGFEEFQDRHRFQKRIKYIELILCTVLNQRIKKNLFDVLPFYILYSSS